MPKAVTRIKPTVHTNGNCNCMENGSDKTTNHTSDVIGYFITETLFQKYDFYATATCENHKENYKHVAFRNAKFITPKELQEQYEVLATSFV